VLALEHQVELINRFPDQNPHPVMRMADDGVLLYANLASHDVVAAIGAEVGAGLPADLVKRLIDASASGNGAVVEVVSGWKTFALLPVGVPEFSFVNIYGTDVTALKVLARFPDGNPNPVLRVSEEGVLLYANAASREVTWSFGCVVGQALPDEIQTQIRGALDGTMPSSFEVESVGHTYALLPVRVAEFSFINVYGTDITARKAINKFPDQNPNPVLRVGQDGRLAYANKAAAAVQEAFGVAVGEELPARWLAQIRDRVDRDSEEIIELEGDGRIFAILVKAVPEFKFINLYGTDITAARQIEHANAENERLLLNILPAPIAARLRAGERVIADRFDDVTLLFADIVDFTAMSSRMSADQLVEVLNDVFSLFDGLVDTYRLEKIKTIGDSYMVVGGIEPGDTGHTERVAEMALALSESVTKVHEGRHAGIRFRVGMHRGPAVAGVIGVKKFIYDVWGDTVNTASRMESHGIPGRVQVTQAVHDVLPDRFILQPRGLITVKGKGPMPTWFLTGLADPEVRRPARAPAVRPR